MKYNGKYILTNNTDTKYVTGVYGGAGIKNEIIAHFFYERFNIPETYEIISEDGERVVSKDNQKKYDYVREVNTSITMDLGTAKSIYNWLGRHIDELESRMKKDE